MYAVRLWSVRHARLLAAFTPRSSAAGRGRAAARAARLRAPRAPRRGARARREGPPVRLPDVRPMRAQLDRHGMSDEMPEELRNGPCGGVRPNGHARSSRRCAASGSRPGAAADASRRASHQAVQPPVDRRLWAARPGSACCVKARNSGAARGHEPTRLRSDPRRRTGRSTGAPPSRDHRSRARIPARRSILPGHTSPGRLERVLRAGEFAITAELSPPDSADPDDVYRRAPVFDGWVDAINATDGTGANCHMSSLAVCALLTRVGYAPVMQISCRDKNRIAIQGDILGAAAMGVATCCASPATGCSAATIPRPSPCSTSTPPPCSRPSASCATRAAIIPAAARQPPRAVLGAAENPFVSPLELRALRLAKKIAAGAQFVQTQYCYDLPLLDDSCRGRGAGLHERGFILVGVGPLASARAARWIREHVPGVHIPDTVIVGSTGGPASARRASGLH